MRWKGEFTMNNEEQKQADLDMLKRTSEQLSEHFDTVQIFVTSHMAAELDGTRTINYGSGNWFARYGQVRMWVTDHEERERQSARDFVKGNE